MTKVRLRYTHETEIYVLRLQIFLLTLLYKKLNEYQEVAHWEVDIATYGLISGKVLHKLSPEPVYKLDVKIWP